ncbi:MAG: methyltransferase domain-containing protein [Proteobacteria bacterium]|nr:methyltransferase domain-containing protein [Pseudomonadota bacterium]
MNDSNTCTWDPSDYHRSSSEQQKWARELIAKLSLNGTLRVLDIGSGDGKVSAEISKQLPNGFVHGIDSSKEMIHFATSSFPRDKFPNLSFEEMDAQSLSFEGGFDVVFSNATLHWVPDHLSVLNGIARSLNPLGIVLLQMGGSGNAAQVFEVLNKTLEHEKWKPYFTDFTFSYSFYSPNEYNIWLKQVGLKVKSAKLIPKDMTHTGNEGLASWIRTTWLPYTQRIPKELREEFISELAVGYTTKYPTDNKGLVHVRMVRLEILATKP